MKYVIWVAVFFSYLLVFVGIFRLIGSATAGLEVEMQVEREVYGEIKIRTQMVEFNEIPAVKWFFGMSGLLIAVGGGFITSDFMGRAWDGDEEKKRTKTERLILAGTFTVLFFAFSFIFKVHSVDEIFYLPGLIFMAVTCAGTYLVSAALCKLAVSREKKSEVA